MNGTVRRERVRSGLGAGTTVAAAAALATALLGGCQVVEGVSNAQVPIGQPFEAAFQPGGCAPMTEGEKEAHWRTGQIEFIPIRRDGKGLFYIPEPRKDVEVCFDSTAHVVVYLVPENEARKDAWISRFGIVAVDKNDDPSPPPADEFVIDDQDTDDMAVGVATTTEGCEALNEVEGERRHVVVFNRNTIPQEYVYRVCVQTTEGVVQEVDPRIKNRGRHN